MTVTSKTSLSEALSTTSGSIKKGSKLKALFSFFKELNQDIKMRKIGYRSSFFKATYARERLSEEVLFRSSESGCPTIFTTAIVPFNGDLNQVSIKCSVKNKFQPHRPLVDLIDELNPSYPDGSIRYLESDRAKAIRINTMQIPFDVEEILIVASSYIPFSDEMLTFSDINPVKIYMRDFHSKDDFCIINLSEEYPHGNGYVIGSLVRGYVVQSMDEWVFLHSSIPVRNKD